MTNPRSLLKRARVVERVRHAEQLRATRQVGDAELVRCKFERLADRTANLCRAYSQLDGADDAASLGRAIAFATHLVGLSRTTRDEAERARATADLRLDELATANRWLERASENHRAARLAVGAPQQDFAVRKRIGTLLE